MTIACLGWGSLVWRPKNLPCEDWRPDGPVLPVEFARISRGDRVTLVIVDGVTAVSVLWSPLKVSSLDAAVSALAAREEVPDQDIGRWPAPAGAYPHCNIIAKWAAEHDIEGVVWAALKPGFPGQRGAVPKLEQVLAHLDKLQGLMREGAIEYVRQTPKQITTANRAAIEAKLGLVAEESAITEIVTTPSEIAHLGQDDLSNDNDPAGMPAAFFATLANSLKAQGGVDGDLAEILAANLLTTSPTGKAVDQAYAAIVALAEKRATSSDESANG